uniref:Ig-like domain-containing protein n=1 Tax=Oncorhynchus mykiss TaxID=8022 RepID=A0A8K9XN03_ONCMY
WVSQYFTFLFHGLAWTESSSISQKNGLMSANVGDTVVLLCFNKGDVGIMFSWYKQSFGNIPQLISTIYKYDRNATFYHEFKDNPRFSVEGGQGKNHLMIADVELSDTGTYYCGSAFGNNVEFGQGFILIIKSSGSRNMPVMHQSVSESVQPGDSVTLNCTIHTETCAGEHSVYWFRHGSGESHPGIIYTHGDRKLCLQPPQEEPQPPYAGTYYCAVASCGEILFGNGTKLDDRVLLVYCLGAALGLCFIIIIVLGCVLYKISSRESMTVSPHHTLSTHNSVHCNHNTPVSPRAHFRLRQYMPFLRTPFLHTSQ